MHTRNFTVIALLCFATIVAIGQEWAPIGAKWYYEKTYAIFPPVGYVTIESVGDTTINNIQCKILQKSDPTCSDIEPRAYMYSDSGKVYWFNPVILQFTLLYDFTAEKDSSWQLISPAGGSNDTCLVTITVDSTSSIIVNNDTLKKLYVTDNLGMFNGEIVERMGHFTYMFPYPYFCPVGDTIFVDCFDDYSYPLRCYQDSIIGFYQRWNTVPCDTEYVPTITELEFNQSFKLFPIPTDDVVHFSVNHTNLSTYSTNTFVYKIYNSVGSLMETGSIESSKGMINLRHFDSGVYYLEVYSQDKYVTTTKIIKL